MSMFPIAPTQIRPWQDEQGRMDPQWLRWFKDVADALTALQAGSPTFTGTVVTAPLTGLGAAGSMTFVNGILVSQVPAT